MPGPFPDAVNTGGDAVGDRSGRQVPGDDGARADQGVGADRDSGEDD